METKFYVTANYEFKPNSIQLTGFVTYSFYSIEDGELKRFCDIETTTDENDIKGLFADYMADNGYDFDYTFVLI